MKMFEVLQEHLNAIQRNIEKRKAKKRSIADMVSEHQDLKSYWARGSIGAGIMLFLRGDM